VTCPGAPTIQCRNGQCIDPLLTPLVRDRVVGSGGDCAARPGGGQGGLAGAVLVALAAAASARRRRRRGESGVEVVR
jgi:MYXO-CTERM domain-containing protein